MKSPSDGWDSDERDVLESAELRRALDGMRERRGLDEEGEARLLARIQREARAESANAREKQGWLRWGLMLAAASVLLVAGTLWILRRGDATLPGPTTSQSTVAVDSPSPPVFYLPLDKPAVKISPASLAYRGPGGENPLLADLKPAFDAFRAADYPSADREFSAIAGRYPTSVEIAFYQGVARLFLDNPKDAIASFTVAERLADSSFAWDVAWYRAVAEERAGNPGGARSRLAALCARADTRAGSACEALKRLPQ
jgi:hypothetical protein